MSLKAITWVLESSGVQEHGDFRLLIALADRAHDDGSSAYPAVAWLAKRMSRSERTVLRGLERLKEAGVIRLGDQDLVSHFRPDRRPVVYDIVMDSRGVTSDDGVSLLTKRDAERGDSSVQNGVTPDVIQTVPSSSLRSEENRPGGQRASRRATRISEDWMPKPETIAWAKAEHPHVDLKRSHETFVNHWVSASRNATKLDWDRAWRNWVIKDSTGYSGSRPSTSTTDAVEGWNSLLRSTGTDGRGELL